MIAVTHFEIGKIGLEVVVIVEILGENGLEAVGIVDSRSRMMGTSVGYYKMNSWIVGCKVGSIGLGHSMVVGSYRAVVEMAVVVAGIGGNRSSFVEEIGLM